jgi:outer membrane biosynthesis protein TonB
MDFLKVTVIILFIILTILTIKIHPEIHQPMLIEDENFKLVRISDTLSSENTPTTIAISPTEQKTVTQQTTPVQNNVDVRPVETKTVQTRTINMPKKEVQTYPQNQTQNKKQVSTSKQEPSQLELLQRLLNTDIEDTKALEENAQKLAQTMQQPQKVVSQPQKTTQTRTQTPQTSNPKNPYMTEQEELIAWNKWRSNIHNQVMRDSNAGIAPYGTVFTFSFLVDKYGNVSNVKVSCSNDYCMNIARNNLKPAISNLQKKPILNFPRGTQRTSVVVNGSFLIGSEDKFSTPSNFSDVERVVH